MGYPRTLSSHPPIRSFFEAITHLRGREREALLIRQLDDFAERNLKPPELELYRERFSK